METNLLVSQVQKSKTKKNYIYIFKNNTSYPNILFLIWVSTDIIFYSLDDDLSNFTNYEIYHLIDEWHVTLELKL